MTRLSSSRWPVTVAAVGAIAAAAGCQQPATTTDEPRLLYSLFDIQAALAEGRSLPAGPQFPGGISPDTVLTRGEAGDVLKVTAAFSEGEPAAYVTTDLWVNYDEVWVQPWYVLITAWNEKAPRQNQIRDSAGKAAPPLIDVGPRSAFYSPYWMVYFALVPEGTTIDTYTSTRQILDDKLPLYPETPTFYSFRPSTVGVGAMKAVHPILGLPVGTLSALEGALMDGEALPYLLISSNNFRYDERWVVEEVPLFIFVRRESNGAAARINAPDVMGSSPLFSRRSAEVGNGQPRFGAFARFYLAYLPATAAPFDPALYPDTVARLAALPVPLDPKVYQGRVAMNGRKVAETDVDCFAAEAFPAGCRWLDSQQRVEEELGRPGIERTSVTAATPLVFYGGKATGSR
jgi:hypothetical protein